MDRNIGAIRLEYEDGKWLILDPSTLRHLKDETKIELNLTLSKVYDEIDARRIEAEKKEGVADLGVQLGDTVGLKDKMGG